MTTRGKVAVLPQMPGHLDPQGLERKEDIGEQEGHRSQQNKKVQEKGTDQGGFRMQAAESLEEKKQNHEARKKYAPHQKADRCAQETGAPEENMQLVEKLLAALTLRKSQLPHAAAGFVDGTSEPVGDGEKEETDPGDEHRRGNGKLHELGDGLDVEGIHRRGMAMFPRIRESSKRIPFSPA